MTNTMKNTVEKTYSVDIRNLAETRCGIFFDEVPMVRPVTGVLSMEGDAPTITPVSYTHLTLPTIGG